MTIDVSKLSKRLMSVPVNFTEVIDVSSSYNLTESAVSVCVDGKVTNMGSFFLLEASMTAAISFNCDKCLESSESLLNINIYEKYSDSVENDEFWLFTGKTLDLSPALESNLFLHIPIRLLCDDECKGLCYICGHNLNVSECGCIASQMNPKLEVLSLLFHNKEV